MEPRKGDQVCAEIKGFYSHQGVPSGWHIVRVGDRQVAVPPDTYFTILARAVLEPQGPVVVEATGNRAWAKHRPRDETGAYLTDLAPWRALHLYGASWWTWEQILNTTRGGAELLSQSGAQTVDGQDRRP